MTPRPTPQNPFDKLSVFQAAAILGVAADEVRRAIFKGQLRAVRIDGRRRIRRDQVMALKAKREAENV